MNGWVVDAMRCVFQSCLCYYFKFFCSFLCYPFFCAFRVGRSYWMDLYSLFTFTSILAVASQQTIYIPQFIAS
jgi:hypothetical protein